MDKVTVTCSTVTGTGNNINVVERQAHSKEIILLDGRDPLDDASFISYCNEEGPDASICPPSQLQLLELHLCQRNPTMFLPQLRFILPWQAARMSQVLSLDLRSS